MAALSDLQQLAEEAGLGQATDADGGAEDGHSGYEEDGHSQGNA